MEARHIRRLAGWVAGVFVLLVSASAMRADTVSITLSEQISGNAGQSVTVFATLLNNTSNAVYFSDDNFTINGSGFTASDDLITNGLLGIGPVSIDPNGTLMGVDLFTVQIAGGVAPGTFSNNVFGLSGGTDPIACSQGITGCDNALGTLNFSVSVPGSSGGSVPEPSAVVLLGVGAALMGLLKRRA